MSFQFLQKETRIDFIGLRRYAYVLSVVVFLIGAASIFMNGGLRYGVDFAGGAAVQLQFANPVADENIKGAFASLNLPGLAVQQYGEDGRSYLVRFSAPDMSGEEIRAELGTALQQKFTDNTATIERMEMVGPKVGADLRNAALQAMYIAVLLITVYISGRFEQRWVIAAAMAAVLGGAMFLMNFTPLEMTIRVFILLLITAAICWKLKLNYALGAVVGLVHDVSITVGILALLGKEFDLNVIAALLTLVGYSLNDKIIVFDRIRENLRRQKAGHLDPLTSIINMSVNQTLSRTIMTGLTTLLASVSLMVLGGGTIHDFALTMTMGVFIGTYSSIFICNPVLLLGTTEQYIMAEKAGSEKYERPGEHGVV